MTASEGMEGPQEPQQFGAVAATTKKAPSRGAAAGFAWHVCGASGKNCAGIWWDLGVVDYVRIMRDKTRAGFPHEYSSHATLRTDTFNTFMALG